MKKKVPRSLHLTSWLMVWLAFVAAGAVTFHSLESTYEEEAAAVRTAQADRAGIPPLNKNAKHSNATEEAEAATAVEADRQEHDSTSGHQSTWKAQYQRLMELLLELRSQCKQLPSEVGSEDWTAAGSLFFAFQAMTTIGYGTFTPQTPGGRVMTIVFGAVGIVKGTGF